MVPSGGSAGYTGALNTGSVGLAQPQLFSLNAGDEQALPGANGLTTLSQTLSLNVLYDASPSYSGTTLDLGSVHAGYAGSITSAGSIAVTNGNPGDLRANLYGSGSGSYNVSLTPLSGVQPGGSPGAVQAMLANGTAGGTLLNQNVTYTFADDPSVLGVIPTSSTAAINVTGQVYSGQMPFRNSASAAGFSVAGDHAQAAVESQVVSDSAAARFWP